MNRMYFLFVFIFCANYFINIQAQITVNKDDLPTATIFYMPVGERLVNQQDSLRWGPRYHYLQGSSTNIFSGDYIYGGNTYYGWYVSTNFNTQKTYDDQWYNDNHDYHTGEDWNGDEGNDLGQPIYAIGVGIVAYVHNDGSGGYGNHIQIIHELTDNSFIVSHYAHLQSVSVSQGDLVDNTTQIGLLGNTGNSTGPHLHLEIRRETFLDITSTTVSLKNSGSYTLHAWPGENTTFIVANYYDPSTFLKEHNLLGKFDNGTSQGQYRDESYSPSSISFIGKYNQLANGNPSHVLGEPYNNGGGVYVHEFYGMYVQDFKAEDKNGDQNWDNGYDHPHTALIAKSNGMQSVEAYLLKEGFWDFYMNHEGWCNFGAPTSDEYSENGYTWQNFENGCLRWYSGNLIEPFETNKTTPKVIHQYCNFQVNGGQNRMVGGNDPPLEHYAYQLYKDGRIEKIESIETANRFSTTTAPMMSMSSSNQNTNFTPDNPTTGDGVYHNGQWLADLGEYIPLVHNFLYSNFYVIIDGVQIDIAPFTVTSDTTFYIDPNAPPTTNSFTIAEMFRPSDMMQYQPTQVLLKPRNNTGSQTTVDFRLHCQISGAIYDFYMDDYTFQANETYQLSPNIIIDHYGSLTVFAQVSLDNKQTWQTMNPEGLWINPFTTTVIKAPGENGVLRLTSFTTPDSTFDVGFCSIDPTMVLQEINHSDIWYQTMQVRVYKVGVSTTQDYYQYLNRLFPADTVATMTFHEPISFYFYAGEYYLEFWAQKANGVWEVLSGIDSTVDSRIYFTVASTTPPFNGNLEYVKYDPSLSDHLVAYFTFDQESGDALDMSGNNYAMTNVNSVTYDSGMIGYAADFGITASRSLSAATNFGIEYGDHSFNCWVKYHMLPPNDKQMAIYAKEVQGKPQQFFNLDYRHQSGYGYVYNIWTGSTMGTESKYAITENVNQWIMMTITFSGAEKKIYVYRNGTEILTLTTSSYSPSVTQTLFGNWVTERTLYGMMDEAGMWSRQLTPAEITALYNSGNGVPFDSTIVIIQDTTSVGDTIAPTIVSTSLQNGLKAYYRFNEESGDAADATANGFTLTNYGSVSYNEGKIGGGANYGISGIKSLHTTSPLGITGSGSQSFNCWVKYNKLPDDNTQMTLYDKEVQGVPQQYFNLDYRQQGGYGYIYNIWTNSNGGTEQKYTITENVSEWIMLTVTFNSTENKLRVYRNGIQILTLNTGTTYSPSTTHTYIGNWGTGRTFYGCIDEVGVWDRLITSEEITLLYNSGSGIAYDSVQVLPDTTIVPENVFPSGNLLTYWKLDNSSTDYVGTAHGVNTNITYVSGQMSNAASFNGSSSKIHSTITSGLSSAFTLNLWIKLNSGNPYGLVESHVASYNNYYFYLGAGASGTNLRWQMYNGSTNPYMDSYSNIQTGVWTMVTCVRSTTDNKLKLYINGVADGTPVTDPTITSIPVYSSFDIGSRTNGGELFNGLIDEVGVWSRALTVEEIADLYHDGDGLTYEVDYIKDNPSLSANLVSYYPFNQTSGNAEDVTDNSYDLTNINSVTYSSGKFGNCATFGSTNTNKRLSIVNDFGISSDFTISYWYKNSGTDKEFDGLVLLSWADGVRNTGILRNGNNNRWYIFTQQGSGNQLSTVESVTNNTWYHIIAENSGGTISMYVNNVIKGTVSANTGSTGTMGELFVVGAVPSFNWWGTGYIDELGVWSRALTSDERTKLYLNGEGLPYGPDPLVKESVQPEEVKIPEQYTLESNYPNPFNPSTTIKYSLPTTEQVSLKIYNILGQEVITLVDELQDAGYKQAVWNAKDVYGNQVASGIYIYRLQTDKFVQSKKMILLK